MNKLFLILLSIALFSCSENKIQKKGFPVNEATSEEGTVVVDSLSGDTLRFNTKPRNVLLTYHAAHRLTPIYKVNYHKKTNKPFTGSNAFHANYWYFGEQGGNNWNRNFMPGFEAVYGYNFVNISHFNNESKEAHLFFEEPVLVKTLYYPAFSKDTLNGVSVKRNYYMVSVYDEDTNEDGYVNVKDLRRFYYFDINASNKSTLIPKNYSVLSSEYDPENDFMYVFAQLDKNENGQMEYEEPTHIFWIDLAAPSNRGSQYVGDIKE